MDSDDVRRQECSGPSSSRPTTHRDFGNWQNRPAATTQAYLKMRQEVDAALAGRADRPAALRRAEAWAKHGNISPQEYEELVGLIERLH